MLDKQIHTLRQSKKLNNTAMPCGDIVERRTRYLPAFSPLRQLRAHVYNQYTVNHQVLLGQK